MYAAVYITLACLWLGIAGFNFYYGAYLASILNVALALLDVIIAILLYT